MALPKPSLVEAEYTPTASGSKLMRPGMMGMQDLDLHADHDHETGHGVVEFLTSQKRSCTSTQDEAFDKLAISPPDVPAQQAQDASDIAERSAFTAHEDATVFAVGSGGETIHGTTHARAQDVPAHASHEQPGISPFNGHMESAEAVQAQATSWSSEVKAAVSDSADHSRAAAVNEHVEVDQQRHPDGAPEASEHMSGYNAMAEPHPRANMPNSLETDLSVASISQHCALAHSPDKLGSSGVVNGNIAY